MDQVTEHGRPRKSSTRSINTNIINATNTIITTITATAI
jgi:hypothetical protein